MSDPRDRTLGEAEAYADGLASAAVAARAMARRIRAAARGCAIAESNAATLELLADALADDMPQRGPTGLCYRGG
jgi:hypothetical protein